MVVRRATGALQAGMGVEIEGVLEGVLWRINMTQSATHPSHELSHLLEYVHRAAALPDWGCGRAHRDAAVHNSACIPKTTPMVAMMDTH